MTYLSYIMLQNPYLGADKKFDFYVLAITKVLELSSQGYSEREISKIIKVSDSTVQVP
jgi:hypothetical protein